MSTGSDVNGSWNRGCLQFFYDGSLGYGTSGPDNNGNVLFANTYIPLDEQTSTWAIHRQSYSYDSLNRLASVAESFVSNTQAETQQSLQSYNYDRWGNRTISPGSWGVGINTKQFSVDTATNRLGVPTGQSGVMTYDNAGNLVTDTYTGVGNRTYDAENRMVQAWGGNNQWQYYNYNADGQRTRRKIDGFETWQIYGLDGELLAEYGANAAVTNPQKEYGYRNGQLLITAEASTPPVNVALAGNGGLATASSVYGGTIAPPNLANDGDRKGTNNGWGSSTNAFPQWLQVDFSGSKTIGEIDVFTTQDNFQNPVEPTESMTFSLYGLTGFDVQYWNGSAWTTISGGSVTGNNKVWRKFTFTAITTSKIRVLTNASIDDFSRITEVEAWQNGEGSGAVNWLVPDHLGTPRMVIDQTGYLSNVKRHDYLPFGEELFAPAGGRNAAQGYAPGDGVRQQFTAKERDLETGLDYFYARYYSGLQGRFTSADSYFGTVVNPQTFNLYAYVRNNPLRYTDPLGHSPQDPQRPHPNTPCSDKAPCDSDENDRVVINVDHKRDEPIGWDAQLARWTYETNHKVRNWTLSILKFQLAPVTSWTRLIGGDEAVTELHHASMALLPIAFETGIEVGVEETAAAMEGEMDAVMMEGLVYRAGGFTPRNFTPSLDDAASGGLSTFD